MKKTIIVAVCVLVLVITGCSSIMPLSNAGVVTNLVEKDYKVLGKVDIDCSITNILFFISFGGKGYKDLIDQARLQYPTCDEVINICEDRKNFTVLGVYNRFGKVLSGTAIEYID
ncbi:MAG: hypothetical protein GX903_01560 [Spirochaetales bacterium]|nr:hypothetical protein [Spirochaetales bacterium]